MLKKVFSIFKNKILILNVVLSVVLSVLIINGALHMLEITTLHNSKIEVPNVKSLSFDNAKKILELKELDIHIIDTSFYNKDFPKNSIVKQIPKEKSLVKKGRKILVTINAEHYRKIEIPDVLHLTKRQAVNKLNISGFKLGDIYYVDYYGKDIVLGLKHDGKTVNSGEKISINSKIDIVVGNGKN